MKRILLSIFTITLLGLLFTAPPTYAADDINIIAPNLQVDIPGLQFTSPKDIQIDPTLEASSTVFTIQIPFIGQYLAAFYRYAVAIAAIISIIMIIVAGFQWTFSGGSQDTIGSAKKRIINAVTGLVLVAGSYTILYTINPELVKFRSLSVTYIEGIPDDKYSEEEIEHLEGNTKAYKGGVGSPIAPGLIDITGGKIPTPHIELLVEVAKRMQSHDPSYGVIITSGYRTLEHQKELIYLHCKNPPGSKKCDPLPGKPLTCILRGLDPANCPHTTGYAIDAWGTKDGVQCIYQEKCSTNMEIDACRKNPCQLQLIAEMKRKGYCVLDKEAWHFEKPIISENKKTGVKYCH